MSLSEKIIPEKKSIYGNFVKIEDVKEFIKKDDLIICAFAEGLITEKQMWKERAELLGDKLTLCSNNKKEVKE